jgi:hypothetical protein
MKTTIGRIVLYRLTEQDAAQINRRRTSGQSIAERISKNTDNGSHWPLGAQAHIGNTAYVGEVCPLIIVRVWPNEYGEGSDGVNGQVWLDGNDQLWVTSAREGTTPGTWAWPVIEKIGDLMPEPKN